MELCIYKGLESTTRNYELEDGGQLQRRLENILGEARARYGLYKHMMIMMMTTNRTLVMYGLGVSVFQCPFSCFVQRYLQISSRILLTTGLGNPPTMSMFLYVVHINVLHYRILSCKSLVTVEVKWKIMFVSLCLWYAKWHSFKSVIINECA